MITERQIFLVQYSFRQVGNNADQLATIFYNHLFELDPSLEALFKGDLQEQKRKLLHMLSLLIGRLDNINVILPAVQDLGKNHATSYGVKQEHYALVGEALLWALQQQLKKRFTPEVETAWTDAYQLIATTAIQAAYTPEIN